MSQNVDIALGFHCMTYRINTLTNIRIRLKVIVLKSIS